MPNISWESFENYNNDSRGIEYKFEDLCRQLFMNEHMPLKHYLHADPNNPGLETEPIISENGEKIGFQAKFFDGNVDYSNIYHSAEMIVKHYKGDVDKVYIFCNKPLKRSSCEKTFELLNDADIVAELVTDNAILDLVRRHPYLAYYYFDNHSISLEWLKDNMGIAFDGLGNRFNKKFNIPTHTSDMLSLFVRDDVAVDYINNKKSSLLKELEETKWKYYAYSDYICVLNDAISKITDVTIDTLPECTMWYCQINQEIAEKRRILEDDLDKARIKASELSQKAFGNPEGIVEKTRDAARKECSSIRNDIYSLQDLIYLPEKLKLTPEEQGLFDNSCLLIDGEAGCGKTQLLATETKLLLDSGRLCLFVAAGTLLSDNQIEHQIMEKLNLNYSFDELLDVLNAAGERSHRIVPIFLDAINETWNHKLWEDELPQLVAKIKKREYLRVVVSYRSEYEKSLIHNRVLSDITSGHISSIRHYGFRDNSINATKVFLNENNIPFTPSTYFMYELSNPLFLTLYCKAYNGSEIELSELYEKVISQANQNLFNVQGKVLSSKGYNNNDDIVGPFVYEFAEWCVTNKRKFVRSSELLSFSYWKSYDLVAPVFIKFLSTEHILYDIEHEGEKCYYFAYDQMNDYF